MYIWQIFQMNKLFKAAAPAFLVLARKTPLALLMAVVESPNTRLVLLFITTTTTNETCLIGKTRQQEEPKLIHKETRHDEAETIVQAFLTRTPGQLE